MIHPMQKTLNKKLDQLTTLRFFAAWMIVIHHCAGAGLFGFSHDHIQPFKLGQGVSFFFVLSGFILTYVYPKLGSYKNVLNFFHARFARIWPIHAAVFLLALWIIPFNWEWKTAFANLLLVQAWIPLRSFYWSYNAPSWSISAEFFFYLAFPVLIHRWEKNWQIKMLASSAILAALIFFSKHAQLPNYDYAMLFISPISRIFEFIFGIFISFIWQNYRQKNAWSITEATLIETAIILLCYLSMHYTVFFQKWVHTAPFGSAISDWLEGSGSTLPFGLLIYVIAIGRGKISKILSQPYFVLLGEISYSIYVLHYILIRYYELNIAFFPHSSNLWAFFIFCSILLLSSYIMWSWFEMPSRRLILRGRRAFVDNAIEESWPYKALQQRNVMLAAILLCSIILPLLLSMENIGDIPLTTESVLAYINKDRTNTVKALIDAGVSINSKDERGATPLIEASWDGNKNIVKFLLDKNADINVCTNASITALLAAVFKKNEKIAFMLLEHGADPNIADANGTSPLIEATWQGNIVLMNALIAKGADVNYIRPSDEVSALALAKSQKNNLATRTLLDAGAIK